MTPPEMGPPEMGPAPPGAGTPADPAARLRAAADAAARGYFDARRARVEDFVARTFTFRATLRLHRAALGLDLVRAPANIALSPVQLAAQLGARGAERLGRRRSAAWLRGRRLSFETAVGRAVRDAVIADLLELPLEDGGRDALAEAILRDPGVAALLPQAGAARAGMTLRDYLGARDSVAEMTTALTAAGVGAAAFKQFAPGAMSLGPAVAGAMANAAAASSFPFGATAGAAWYAAFPAAASPALVVGATAGVAMGAATLGAFAGVAADPIQAKLGIHQKRLRSLIDAMETDFLGGDGPGFTAREQYYARLFDLADAAASALRAMR